MPVLAGFAAVFAGLAVPAFFAGTLGFGTFVTAALITGIGYVSGLLLRRPSRGLNLSLASRSQFVRAEVVPRRIFYGNTQFAPSIAWIDVERPSGSDRGLLHMVLPISDHPFDALTGLLLNGAHFLTPRECELLSTTGDILTITETTGSPTANVGMLRQEAAEALGEGDQTVAVIGLSRGARGNLSERMAVWGIKPPDGFADWESTDMRGTGISWIYIQLPTRYGNNRKAFGSVPPVQLQVSRGVAGIADIPGLANQPPGDNAARCAYDYAVRYTTYGEQVLGQGRIDIASVQESARVCEERNFRASGVLTLEDGVDSVLEAFNQAMGGGDMIDQAGVLAIRAAGFSSALVTTFTEDDVLPGWKIQPSLPRESRSTATTVRYAYHNPATRLAEVREVSVLNKEAYNVFGQRSEQLETGLVDDRSTAASLALRSLSRQWNSMRISIITNLRGLGVEPGDRVRLDLPGLSVPANRDFVVVSREIGFGEGVKLDLYQDTDLRLDQVDIAGLTDGAVVLGGLNTPERANPDINAPPLGPEEIAAVKDVEKKRERRREESKEDDASRNSYAPRNDRPSRPTPPAAGNSQSSIGGPNQAAGGGAGSDPVPSGGGSRRGGSTSSASSGIGNRG